MVDGLAELTILPLEVDTGGRSHEQRSIRCREQALDHMAGQAICRPERAKAAPVVTVEAVLCSHPDEASMVLRDAVDVEIAQACGDGGEAINLCVTEKRRKAHCGQAVDSRLQDADQLARNPLQCAPSDRECVHYIPRSAH